MLPSERRLTTRQFQEVYQDGSVHPGRLLVLRTLPRDEGPSRWGFAIGKKLVRSAPGRAKWRRRLRTVVADMTDSQGDCVITMRQAGLRATLPALQSELTDLVSKARTQAASE